MLVVHSPPSQFLTVEITVKKHAFLIDLEQSDVCYHYTAPLILIIGLYL